MQFAECFGLTKFQQIPNFSLDILSLGCLMYVQYSLGYYIKLKLKCSTVQRTQVQRGSVKGHLIFKISFLYLQFFQKNQRRNSIKLLQYLKLNYFRSFFGRIEKIKKDISKLTDLQVAQKTFQEFATLYTSMQ